MSELADLLLKSGDLEFDQLESVRGQQASHGGRLEHLLVEGRMIPEKTLVAAIARVSGVPPVNLDALRSEGSALARLPDAFCWETVCFPVGYDEGTRTVTVALTDPTDIGLIDQVIRQSGCRVSHRVAGVLEIRRAIRRHYRGEYVPDEEMTLSPDNPSQGEEEEFKITDISGKTLMTSLQALKDKHDAQVAARAGGAAPEAPPPPLGASASAIDDLFEIRALSPEEAKRLTKVQNNVHKSGIILAAILELLEEKRVLARDELNKRAGVR